MIKCLCGDPALSRRFEEDQPAHNQRNNPGTEWIFVLIPCWSFSLRFSSLKFLLGGLALGSEVDSEGEVIHPRVACRVDSCSGQNIFAPHQIQDIFRDIKPKTGSMSLQRRGIDVDSVEDFVFPDTTLVFQQ